MKYKNGKEPKVGDLIVGRDNYGTLITGIVTRLNPSGVSDTILVQPFTHCDQMRPEECLTAEDAMK